MKRSNEFNTCLHFDLSDSLHRKAVEILENYDKKRYHSYTNFIATALTEYTEHQDDDIFIEKITEALTPKITEIVRREIGGYEGKIVAPEMTVSQKSESIRTNDINEKEKNENTMPDSDKEEIINSIDSSFMSTFSTKLNIGTEN
ncbi:MAG: hypothetical protein SOT68_08675 [Oscillospiraceae bacterium]|nr:hypothetical protein [Oscillospiraceae bacterium]